MMDPKNRVAEACRLLIVDDHPIVRCGLNVLFRDIEGVVVCGEARDSESARQAVRELQPDLVVLDIQLPGGSGLDLIAPMREERMGIKILMLSASDDLCDVRRAYLAGAQGYVTKQQLAPALVEAVRAVRDGGRYLAPQYGGDRVLRALTGASTELFGVIRSLSPREYQVFEETGRHQSTTEIARNLRVSIKTVETHRGHVMEKVRVENVAELRELAAAYMQARPLHEGGRPAEEITFEPARRGLDEATGLREYEVHAPANPYPA